MKQRHVISVLVEDHPRVLTRITSMFARRGFNIDSLAVGRTHLPGVSRISFVVEGDDRTLEQVEKQLNRLIEVLKVVDHEGPRLERELALVKVRVEGIEERIELKEIAEAFRAQIVDVARHALTFEVTGHPAKIDRFLEELSNYGVLETMRTGAVAMDRGERVIKLRARREAV